MPLPANGFTTFFYSSLWPVFHEDNHLLVLYKPAGLFMQGDRTGDISLLDLAKEWIKKRHRKSGKVFLALVQRLDRLVAGVTLFCRTSRLSEQFRIHSLNKQYLAIVEGKLENETDELVHHMERHGTNSHVVLHPSQQSREARLTYQTLETDRSRSLVKINLATGRHHQIRVQFSHMGCPVLGDLRYGASESLQDRQIALYADRLDFIHPTLKTQLIFECPVPVNWPWPGMGESTSAPPWNWLKLKEAL